MQLVLATSRSPGCDQRIDDLEMLKRYFRRSSCGSSSSSSGVSSPSLSAPLIVQWFRLWMLFHSLFSPRAAPAAWRRSPRSQAVRPDLWPLSQQCREAILLKVPIMCEGVSEPVLGHDFERCAIREAPSLVRPLAVQIEGSLE
jgi:hypothetical protein